MGIRAGSGAEGHVSWALSAGKSAPRGQGRRQSGAIGGEGFRVKERREPLRIRWKVRPGRQGEGALTLQDDTGDSEARSRGMPGPSGWTSSLGLWMEGAHTGLQAPVTRGAVEDALTQCGFSRAAWL